MPVWKALTDAASTAAAICAPSRGGRPDTSARTSARSSATRTTAIARGRERRRVDAVVQLARELRRDHGADGGDAEQAGGARDRVVEPEAIPACSSSASASTVAVSGATVADSPSENTSSAGSSSVR